MNTNKNRHFEAIALDLLDFCGGKITPAEVNNFWKRESRMKKQLSEVAQLRIIEIAINLMYN